jgi:two-component system sensor histidine kinase PhoQ
MNLSLHVRLLLAASLVLSGFLGLTGAALDRAFRDSSEQALQAQLLGHVYGLLAAADEDPQGGLKIPPLLTDPRFNQPGSGYYARVDALGQGLLWRSPSTTGSNYEFARPQAPGAYEFHRGPDRSGRGERYAISFGVAWEFFDGHEQRYTFSVAQNLGPFMEQQAGFRRTLWFWLGGAAVLLLLVQGAVLGWGLRPLRRVAAELRTVQAGERERLEGTYPRELRGLTVNINSLIHHAQAQQARYRHSMDDLAHSLKNPLAVLQAAAEAAPLDAQQLAATLAEQVTHMSGIVQHQLARAASSGRTTLVRPLAVAPIAERIGRSLHKVYRDKAVAFEMEIPEEVAFPAEEGDLMELLGNLMDNAWKFCRSRVQMAAGVEPRRGLWIRIQDDGPGIPKDSVTQVLQRGRRADQTKPGQGIGLAVADELIRLYGGTLEIGRSELGGADMSIRFSFS